MVCLLLARFLWGFEWALPISDDEGEFLGMVSGLGVAREGCCVWFVFALKGKERVGWEDIIALWKGKKEALYFGEERGVLSRW